MSAHASMLRPMAAIRDFYCKKTTCPYVRTSYSIKVKEEE